MYTGITETIGVQVIQGSMILQLLQTGKNLM